MATLGWQPTVVQVPPRGCRSDGLKSQTMRRAPSPPGIGRRRRQGRGTRREPNVVCGVEVARVVRRRVRRKYRWHGRNRRHKFGQIASLRGIARIASNEHRRKTRGCAIAGRNRRALRVANLEGQTVIRNALARVFVPPVRVGDVALLLSGNGDFGSIITYCEGPLRC